MPPQLKWSAAHRRHRVYAVVRQIYPELLPTTGGDKHLRRRRLDGYPVPTLERGSSRPQRNPAAFGAASPSKFDRSRLTMKAWKLAAGANCRIRHSNSSTKEPEYQQVNARRRRHPTRLKPPQSFTVLVAEHSHGHAAKSDPRRRPVETGQFTGIPPPAAGTPLSCCSPEIGTTPKFSRNISPLLLHRRIVETSAA